jgi:hypothetical protein
MDGLSIHNVIDMKANIWAVISIVFLIWAVVATVGAANYYQISQTQQTTISNLQSLVNNLGIKVNIAINYGNGTIDWHNDTYIPIGFSLFNATQKVATLDYTSSALGIFVTGINGVSQDVTANRYWVYDTWSNGEWEIVWTAALNYVLHDNEIVMWSLKQF